jgi:gingipain R
MYKKDAWYPQRIASLGEPFIQRDFRGCLVSVFPFQYNPVKKVLRVYSSVSLNIRAEGYGTVNLFKRARALSGVDEEFSQLYRQSFLNYPDAKYPVLTEDGGMLILCPSIFSSTIQPFAEWKREKGLKVQIVAVAAGTTASALKASIANAYNASGSALKYVLLVGDANHVPTPSMSPNVSPPGGGGADIIYGEIKGTDCYSELLIGRFSGNSAADIKTQVDKSIYYETNMKSTDAWLSRVLMTASSDQTTNQWGETDADFVNNEYDTLVKAGYAQVYRYNQSGAGGAGCVAATPAMVTAMINSGIACWNYSDHGNKTSYAAVKFTNTNAGELDNTNKYFYTYAVACNTGEFSTGGGDCFAEALMKAQTGGRPAGAVGCYMGSIDQAWDPPYASVKEILEISLGRYAENKKCTLGGIMINGGMAAYPVYNDQTSREVVESFVLFGDPNLQLYTKTPKAMTITHPAKIMTGSRTVRVSGSADGARVCLYNAKESLQSIGNISGGVASISVNPITDGDTVSVTAMLFNHETYRGTMVVEKNETGPDAGGFSADKPRWSNGRLYYRVPEKGAGPVPVSVAAYSLQGALVAYLVKEAQGPGMHSVLLTNKSSGIAAGTYAGEIRIGNNAVFLKMEIQ